MNIEHAKTIPLTEILSKIEIKPAKIRLKEYWYLSPLHGEKTASFKVDLAKNTWYDFGLGVGGDSIYFVCQYLKSQGVNHSVSDALRWLNNMTGYVPVIVPVSVPDYKKEDKKLILRSAKKLQHPALIDYLDSRGIPKTVASQYYQEVRTFNKESKKGFFALGFKNEDGGYELRNPYMKASISPKTITFIRGTEPKPEGIHIFEGSMDYVSMIVKRNGKRFEDDTIVLNSLSCMKDATAYIKGYGYKNAYTWLDNDEPGEKATQSFDEFFKTEQDLTHKAMNSLYEGYKDVNAWHMMKLNLPL